jgi:dimethylhistidine N-methyltransferase
MLQSLSRRQPYKRCDESSNQAWKPKLHRATLTADDFRRDAIAGLSQCEKRLPCKYLYDERGARLFEQICELPEYYPTRTEMAILKHHIGEIVALAGPCCRLVDLGSGSGSKARLVLDALDQPASYVPVDVAGEQLGQNAARLAEAYPALDIQPHCADYTGELDLPASRNGGKTLVFFPGSTIGNFEPDEAMEFLRRLGRSCKPEGGLLIGVDLKKDPQMLHAAYNDSQGVTAAFNLNLLSRANRELGAEFDLAQFSHDAVYNEPAGRIEMRLISSGPQIVRVDGRQFHFANGERILTEHSYKYTPSEFRRLAARAGLAVVRCWTDDRRWFSVQFLKPAR